MTIKKLKKGKPRHGATLKQNAGISLDVATIKELDYVATKRGLKRSELVNQIIRNYLDRLGNA